MHRLKTVLPARFSFLAFTVAAAVMLAGCDAGGPDVLFSLTTSASPSEGGEVTRSLPGEEYEPGTKVTLTAKPAEGWYFVRWDREVTGTENPIEVTMDRDKSARAIFQRQSSGGGTIAVAGQDIFLSGGNVAWIRFARDVGPGTTELDTFAEIFQQVKSNGGNAMRLWLHTSGATTPFWDGEPLQEYDSNASSMVTGPGEGTIEDLRAILDLAQQYDIGLLLSLWSFDMLKTTNDYRSPDVPVRNRELLLQEDKLQSYIDNALIPMVEALKGHEAIVAWEIFNEPEGMSDEFGFIENTVPMSALQRFINRAAGAIHRVAPNAKVTNGSAGFVALGEFESTAAVMAAARAARSPAEIERVRRAMSVRYGHEFTTADVRDYYRTLQSAGQHNYYSDQALIDAGGDPDGTLDFYTVHFYEWDPKSLSPFHHDKSYWGLRKPLAVTEFFMGKNAALGNPASGDEDPDATYGVHYTKMYTTLYERGYAGALAWQWYDYANDREGLTINWPRMLENMQTMQNEHPEDVNLSL